MSYISSRGTTEAEPTRCIVNGLIEFDWVEGSIIMVGTIENKGILNLTLIHAIVNNANIIAGYTTW